MDKIVAKYPYFSTLKMIMAKAALELNLPEQTTRLHSAAIAIPDRLVLKSLMEFTPEDAQQVGITQGLDEKDTHSFQEHNKENDLQAIENVLIEENIESNEKEIESSPTASKFEEQKQIIDNFIKSNVGGIRPNKSIESEVEHQQDLSKNSVTLSDNIASENLAVVFEKQGKKGKAIRIYEKLILKYPEKRTYFAGRIEELKRN